MHLSWVHKSLSPKCYQITKSSWKSKTLQACGWNTAHFQTTLKPEQELSRMNRNIPEEVLLNTVIWEEMGDDWKQRCINKNIDLKGQIIKTNSKKIQVMQLSLFVNIWLQVFCRVQCFRSEVITTPQIIFLCFLIELHGRKVCWVMH